MISRVVIGRGEAENSIVMNNCLIDVDDRITDSIIGSYSKITSGGGGKPRGRRFILGERFSVTM